MIHRRLLLAAVIALPALAQQKPPAPAFQNIRSEDDAVTREAGLVHLEPGWADAAELTVGGQLRVRGESWDNFGFGNVNDDVFSLTRVRLHTDLRLCSGFRVFVEGISAFAFDRDLPPAGGKRPIDEDNLDLLNAFGDLSADLFGAKHTLRLGRQELSFGKQRVVSPLDWANTRRTFEGARLISVAGDWRVDTFAVRLVNHDRHGFNDGDSGQDLYGVHAAGKLGGGGLDFYGLGAKREAAKFAAAADLLEEDRFTVGARLYGKVPETPWDYDVEGAYQFGEFGDGDIAAWMASAELGFKVPGCPAGTRLFVGADYASGDGDLKDGDLATFSQLYPLGHAYFGAIDVVGRQNVIDFAGGLKTTPVTGLDTKLEYHYFQKAAREDALYDAGGNAVPAGAGRDPELGQEIDVIADYALDLHAKLSLGYGHFFAGDAITTGKDIDFVYAQAQYTF